MDAGVRLEVSAAQRAGAAICIPVRGRRSRWPQPGSVRFWAEPRPFPERAAYDRADARPYVSGRRGV